MSTLSQIIGLIVDTVLSLLIMLLLLRFYLQIVRGSFRNPIGEFIIKATNFVVIPARRILPHSSRFDLPTLLCAYIAEFLLIMTIFVLKVGFDLVNVSSVLLIALTSFIKLFTTTVYILMGAIVVDALLSWFSPHHPVRGITDTLTRPVLDPIRKVVPNLGGIDVSPIVAFLGLQILIILFQAPVQGILVG